jgi:hypothetical protein
MMGQDNRKFLQATSLLRVAYCDRHVGSIFDMGFNLLKMN